MHNRAQIRHARERWIQRRKNIVEHVWNNGIGNSHWWGADGSLSKNKVHCSCAYCTEKVRNRGWEHRDIKRMIHLPIEDEDTNDYDWQEWWFLHNQWYYETYEIEDWLQWRRKHPNGRL